MAKASKVISRALSLIGVKSSETDVTDQEMTDAIDALNDIMFALDIDGIKIGYTEVTDKDDEVTVPDSTLGYVKSSLAIALAAEYDRQISPELVAQHEFYKNIVLTRFIDIDEPIYPDTLPIGSGYIDGCGYDYQRYFSDTKNNDLLYSNKQSALTDDGEQIDYEG